jgi:hypothetical protein
MDQQGALIAVFISPELPETTAKQRGRFDVDRQRFHASLFHDLQGAFEGGTVAGHDDDLAQCRVALPHFGRIEELKFCFLDGEWQAAANLLPNQPSHVRCIRFWQAYVLQEQLAARQAQHGITAAKISPHARLTNGLGQLLATL